MPNYRHHPIPNPYNPTGADWRDLKRVHAALSTTDYAFVRTILPTYGIFEPLVSTLLHNFIQDLKDANTQSALSPAYLADSPTYDVVRQLLQRRPVGQLAGQGTVGPRDERLGASSVCSEDGVNALVSAIKKGGATRRGNAKAKKDGGAKEKQ